MQRKNLKKNKKKLDFFKSPYYNDLRGKNKKTVMPMFSNYSFPHLMNGTCRELAVVVTRKHLGMPTNPP